MEKIAVTMKQIREYFKKSVYDIEKATKIPHQALYQYENAERTPSILVCIKLLEKLKKK